MAQVTISIDEKTYRMACDEGQEPHLLGLAQRFDAYVSHLKQSFGEIGDQRLLVMSAIMVMDELQEAERKLDLATNQLEEATRGSTENDQAFETIAARLAEITNKLNGRSA